MARARKPPLQRFALSGGRFIAPYGPRVRRAHLSVALSAGRLSAVDDPVARSILAMPPRSGPCFATAPRSSSSPFWRYRTPLALLSAGRPFARQASHRSRMLPRRCDCSCCGTCGRALRRERSPASAERWCRAGSDCPAPGLAEVWQGLEQALVPAHNLPNGDKNPKFSAF